MINRNSDMKRLYSFSQYIDPLFESTKISNIKQLRNKYDIEDLEWKAMRIIPEKGIDKDIEEYYKTSKSKDLLDKITSFVSDGIFEDSEEVKEFMLNVAAVESCYGTNPNTYKRKDYTKGLFQLDKNSALKTIGYKGVYASGNSKRREYIKGCKDKIKNVIGLDWDQIPYESLSKPLYNALAARIFIGAISKSYTYDKETNITKEKDHPIPKTKEEQAKWWKKRYNTESGDGTIESFINPKGCRI